MRGDLLVQGDVTFFADLNVHTAGPLHARGVGYWFVYQDPEGNRGIVKTGVVYKVAFTGLSAYYWAIDELLHPIFGLLGILDALFIVGFVMFLTGGRSRKPA
ncbi:MAG: hypothetical protein A3F70_08500 [Acidobacteria bacterium RIFCSPLOWO2_12_FULL_67_14]|nr:MAG: hypothetical protein A3H29_01665 [Acidobacteria bacterium RIFCSPLOWO2_02_FULL_67_21]OFW40762.1 MAG: hypothetical protein A3F70_08500 [Acidobacteria bacterium RIFCSPLOWO2_12_FULL_67_14]